MSEKGNKIKIRKSNKWLLEKLNMEIIVSSLHLRNSNLACLGRGNADPIMK